MTVTAMSRCQPEGQIVTDGHMREQQRILEHQADAPVLGCATANINAVQRQLPRPVQAGWQRAADDAKKRGFATAAWPLHQAQLTPCHTNGQFAEQRRLAGEARADVLKMQNGCPSITNPRDYSAAQSDCARGRITATLARRTS